MDAPQYQPPPVDPAFEELKAQAKRDDILAAQERVRGDSASILARYGANLAMAGQAGAGPAQGADASDPLSQIFGQIMRKPGLKNPLAA